MKCFFCYLPKNVQARDDDSTITGVQEMLCSMEDLIF